MKDHLALALSGLTLAFHLAFANRYDLFRDELYFIVCGRHPAFGYTDQPPLVPLLAGGTYALGAQTWIVRIPSALAAAALVWLVIAFVRLLGGKNGAAVLAGIAVALGPMFLGITATLNTTTFEPLAWTAVAYALARALLLDDRRALIAAGGVAGLALEAKYAIALWLVALGAGLIVTPERRLLLRRELWIGLAGAAVIALPSIVWQALNGWPFIALVHNAGLKDVAVSPLTFMLNQIVVMNPLAAPLWIAGAIAPFALGALIAPLALPILPPATLIAYERALHFAPQKQERADTGSLPPTFADMLGWHDFVREVAAAWATIPPAERSVTSILADNYGEAAAIDIYGPAYGLPPALSGHNEYGLWGLRGQPARNVLRIQDDPAALRPYCASLRIIAATDSPYARTFENSKAIAFCRDVTPPLAQLWPRLRFLI